VLEGTGARWKSMALLYKTAVLFRTTQRTVRIHTSRLAMTSNDVSALASGRDGASDANADLVDTSGLPSPPSRHG